jgi:hypothetical protein
MPTAPRIIAKDSSLRFASFGMTGTRECRDRSSARERHPQRGLQSAIIPGGATRRRHSERSEESRAGTRRASVHRLPSGACRERFLTALRFVRNDGYSGVSRSPGGALSRRIPHCPSLRSEVWVLGSVVIDAGRNRASSRTASTHHVIPSEARNPGRAHDERSCIPIPPGCGEGFLTALRVVRYHGYLGASRSAIRNEFLS